MRKVSICLVPYNNNEQFKKVLQQVIAITNFDFNDIELIIIDNNTDATLKQDIVNFISPYAHKYFIKHVQNNNMNQLAGATNKAIEVSDSKWFVYLCATDTLIYSPEWLNHMVDNLSDEDYSQGYRIGGTIAHWPNPISDVSKHIHIQGAIFAAYTEYMKNNKYPPQYPFSFCDVMHSARCLQQGFKLKEFPKVFSSMGFVTVQSHEENRQTGKYYITHLHGNYAIK